MKGIGESVPFLENTLVPPLIPVLLKLKPNIIITFNPGKSVTPYFTEVIGRALHRALNHIVSPFIWSDHLEEFPSIYYFEGWGNYVVDISRFLEKKREYAATLYYRYKDSHYQDVKTLEDAKKKAKELEPYEVFTIGTQMPVSPERREKYEYLR